MIITNSAYIPAMQEFLENYNLGQFSLDSRIMQFERDKVFKCLLNSETAFFAEEDRKISGAVHFKELDWDTKFFGFPCAQIDFMHSNTGDPKTDEVSNYLFSQRFDRWRADKKIRFTSAKIDERDTSAIHALENLGFKYIETVFTLRREFDKDFVPYNVSGIREFRKEDIPFLKEISAQSIHDRFYTDKGFASHVDKFRRIWIQNLCIEGAKVFVAEDGGKVAGYVTCKVEKKGRNVGIIKLIGVDAVCRSQGLGTKLAQYAVNWFHENSDVAYVSTQSKNIHSINMYLNAGYKPVPTQVTFHKWTEK